MVFIISNKSSTITRKQVSQVIPFSPFLLNMIIKVLADTMSFQEGKLFVESMGRAKDVLIHRKDDHVYRCVKKFYEKKNNVKQYRIEGFLLFFF